MIEITFEEFHKQHYKEEGFNLYVVKNGLGDVLYVGISENDVWGRWFGFGGHIVWDGKVIYGESPIGSKIEEHLPSSLLWKIQLWTLDDCIDFCQREIQNNRSSISIRKLEPIMIKKLSPSLNISYNISPGRDTTPRNKKEIENEKYLDKMFRDIFDK